MRKFIRIKSHCHWLFSIVLTFATWIRREINYFMVQHKETGNGLYADPKGRPGRDSWIGEKLPCPGDVDQKKCKLRLDYGISESKSMMVFISLATKEMVWYMSIYPEVWFMDCTAGMWQGNTTCYDIISSKQTSSIHFCAILKCSIWTKARTGRNVNYL